MGRGQYSSRAAGEQPRLLVRGKLERRRRRLDGQPCYRLAAADGGRQYLDGGRAGRAREEERAAGAAILRKMLVEQERQDALAEVQHRIPSARIERRRCGIGDDKGPHS